jgi:L-ascorbate metabolism protein UlaG (beta-lactamase superfamily)
VQTDRPAADHRDVPGAQRELAGDPVAGLLSRRRSFADRTAVFARIWVLASGFTPPELPWLPPLDLLLICHNHYDHLDAPTPRHWLVTPPVVVPCGLGRWFRRRGFTRSPSWTGGSRFGWAR